MSPAPMSSDSLVLSKRNQTSLTGNWFKKEIKLNTRHFT